ncbi:hypothetical protein RI844_05645 [Thalassotalea fonticola]|uniref:Ig-like domain-containing protein n=1 Tax=Thalassotalea fonticola TaxID=3065649 RepID=A0ABZ0GRX3_9GAMM|nr:hypothetical protein RI844_05645 [Colwelliaceae bacterium S1-1]
MNKLNLFLVFFCLTYLSACGETKPTVNKAPVITIESTLIINSGSTVELSAVISDPEGDTVNITWQADNQEVSFTEPNESSTSITFPTTNIDMVVVITLIAKDNAGNSSQKSISAEIKADTTTNEAPIISMPADQKALGGQNIVLIATVQDPQDDDVSVEWYAENADITFSDKNNLTTTLALPDVNSELTTTITLKATNTQQNQSEKTLQLIITPNNSEPAPTVNIELVEHFNTISGDVTTLSARLTSNVELESVLWDVNSLNVNDESIENITQGNVTESIITFTAPPVNQLTEFPVKVSAVTAQDGTFMADSVVSIAVDSTYTLRVTLPETVTVDESTSTSITPIIESSHAVDSYQWRWLSEQTLTLLTPNNKVLSISAPSVDSDIQGQLELTVIMGNLSQTVTTELTIENQETASDVIVTASKLIAVKGQAITLNVITENFEQIKQWSWQVSNVQGSNISESNKHFEITAPDVTGQQTMTITYHATLIDGSEVMKIANITVLSESIARSSFNFDAGDIPIIYNNIEKTYAFSFTDQHGLVDALSIDQSLTFSTFEKVELTRDGAQMNLVLKTSTITADYIDFMSLNIVYGDYVQQYPIQLKMRVN